MSGIQPEDGSLPCRNWTTGSELNETREALLTPSSDYDDEEFLRYLWKEYLHPKEYEWALIAGYIVVFIVALVGNVLGESRSPEVPVPPCQGGVCTVAGNRRWVSLPPLETRVSAAAGGKLSLRGKGPLLRDAVKTASPRAFEGLRRQPLAAGSG